MDIEVEAILAGAERYWDLVALVATWVGIVYFWLRRRSDWKRRRFLEHVRFSLNYVHANHLIFRTFAEDKAANVWFNEHGQNLILQAAKATTPEEPFLRLADASDATYLIQTTQHALTRMAGWTHFAVAAGMPVEERDYLFAVTCEKHPGVPAHLIRVLLIELNLADHLFGQNQAARQLENAGDAMTMVRLGTLQQMHAAVDQPNLLVGTARLPITAGGLSGEPVDLV